jgi:hypothetical protein
MKKADKLIKENLINKLKAIYEAQGQTAVFDWVRIYNHNRPNKEEHIPYEYCEACDTKSPSLDHNCLVCGQLTKSNSTAKPKFYQAVLKPIKDVIAHVYPQGGITLEERMPNNACCDNCGGNEWMLLAKESIAVVQGGKAYCECLRCGSTTHL